MHICDVTMFWAPASGGVRTWLRTKRRWLGERPGLRHSLVVPGPRTMATPTGMEIAAAPLPGTGGYRFPLRTAPWVRALTRLEPDLIEAGDPYVPGLAALAAGRLFGVPVIGFYHSDVPRLLQARLGAAGARAAKPWVRRLYSRCDRVLTPSRTMARQLLALGIDRVHVQPLGVDPEFFHPRRRDPALRTRLGIPASARLLVFAGRAAREKNIPHLLRLARLLGRRYHLLLVGAGMPRQVPYNVTVLREFAGREAVADLLASSDLLVHAGDRETFGLIAVEAMASGLPVVAPRCGALAELVVPGTGVLVPPRDPGAMAEAVRLVFHQGAPAMGQRARRHAERNYAWSGVLATLHGHYRELLGQVPDAGPRRACG